MSPARSLVCFTRQLVVGSLQIVPVSSVFLRLDMGRVRMGNHLSVDLWTWQWRGENSIHCLDILP